MKEIKIRPGKARGLGNVVAPIIPDWFQISNCVMSRDEKNFKINNLFFNSFVINVPSTPTNISASTDKTKLLPVGEQATITATLTDSSGGKVSGIDVFLFDNGQRVNTAETNSEGKVTFNYIPVEEGNHNLTIFTKTQGEYAAASSSMSIYVYINTKLSLSPDRKQLSIIDQQMFEAELKDSFGNVLPGKTVEFWGKSESSSNGEVLLGTAVTNNKGIAKYLFPGMNRQIKLSLRTGATTNGNNVSLLKGDTFSFSVVATDLNNYQIPEIPIQLYKDDVNLGNLSSEYSGITNPSGLINFEYPVDAEGIYKLKILAYNGYLTYDDYYYTLFVKSRNNLLPINVWSGTDYNKDITDFVVSGVTAESSNAWSINGERSLMITSSTANWKVVDVVVNGHFASGTQLKSSFNIKQVNEGGFQFYILSQNSAGSQKMSSTYIPYSSNVETIEVVHTVPEDAVLVKVRIQPDSNQSKGYIDNWELFKL